MTTIEEVYKTINERSNFIIKHGDKWKREIASAKNYICTPDMQHWTFGKSAGIKGNKYHVDGGAAKWWLYSLGFVNVLTVPNEAYKSKVIKAFINWSKQVESFDIGAKFQKDQATNIRFELLVHQSLLDKKVQVQINAKDKTQQSFDEGFRTEIVREVTTRNRKLIDLAKDEYGTSCKVCGFNFGETYGTHGEGFIEVHHLNPVSEGIRKTTIKDLRPVCANCHRMLHRGSVLLSIEELKVILKRK
jgi:predicted HNH restriction endonuclease